jgi:hypothetical protein
MSAPGNGCNVQHFKLLICLAMESQLADFNYAYNILITTVKRLSNLNAAIILSAIIPRPLDKSGNFVKSVNCQLQSICQKRAVKFVATYKPLVIDLLSVKIKKTLKSFQNKVPNVFRYHKLISQRIHNIFLVCITLPVSLQLNETFRLRSLTAPDSCVEDILPCALLI